MLPVFRSGKRSRRSSYSATGTRLATAHARRQGEKKSRLLRKNREIGDAVERVGGPLQPSCGRRLYSVGLHFIDIKAKAIRTSRPPSIS